MPLYCELITQNGTTISASANVYLCHINTGGGTASALPTIAIMFLFTSGSLGVLGIVVERKRTRMAAWLLAIVLLAGAAALIGMGTVTVEAFTFDPATLPDCPASQGPTAFPTNTTEPPTAFPTNTTTPATDTPTPLPTDTPTTTNPVCPNLVTAVDTYPGRPQQAENMIAVVEVTGLFFHTAPTVNSTKVRDANGDLKQLKWGDPLGTGIEFRFEIATFDNITAYQIWYGFTDYQSPTLQSWFMVEWKYDAATFTYIQDGDSSMTCENSPPPDELTFLYDRQLTGEFGIAQAYLNDTQNPRNYDGSHRVTVPIPGYPFADFIYDGSGTDSTRFTTETIWVGGLPMTTYSGDDTDCSTIVPWSEMGWRRCGTLGNPLWKGGSRPWLIHGALLVYYTGTASVPSQAQIISGDPPTGTIPGATDSANQSNPVLDGSHGHHIGFFTNVDLSPYINLSTVGNVTVTNASGLSDWANDYLAQIKPGDYVIINPAEYTPHGFVVVGWGPIIPGGGACAASYNEDGILETYYELDDQSSLFINRQPNTVPYVVDFSNANGDPDDRRQPPIPRPFYCSKFNYSAYGAGDFFGANAVHNWYFTHLPDDVQLSDSDGNLSNLFMFYK